MKSVLDWVDSISINSKGELDIDLNEQQSEKLQKALIAGIDKFAARNPEAKQELIKKVIVPAAFKYAKGYMIGATILIFSAGFLAAKYGGK